MHFTKIQLVATLTIGIGSVYAQSISNKCQTTLENILSSPDAQCMNPSALVSIALQSNSSVVDSVNTWLVGLCSQPACSNATLAAVTTNITSGCSTELSFLGFGTSSTSTLIGVIQEAYPVVRQVLCLKDTSDNQLCITESLTNIQNSYGTLTLSSSEKLVSDLISGKATIPKNVTCSDCSKATYNILKQTYPEYVSTTNFSAECGSSFVDGSNPSSISQSSNTATGPESVRQNGTGSLFTITTAIAGAVSALVIISSALIILA